MPYEIDVTVQCPKWPAALQNIESITVEILSTTLKNAIPKHKNIEISVVLADDAFIQNLNVTYRNKDKPTNVLSFPLTEKKEISQKGFLSLGDIVIAFETIDHEAKAQGKSLYDHFTHMLVHGCLHLLHYDHENEQDAKTMETKEIAILHHMQIKNPYENQ